MNINVTALIAIFPSMALARIWHRLVTYGIDSSQAIDKKISSRQLSLTGRWIWPRCEPNRQNSRSLLGFRRLGIQMWPGPEPNGPKSTGFAVNSAASFQIRYGFVQFKKSLRAQTTIL